MSPPAKLSADYYADQPSSKLPDLTGRFIGAGRFKLLKQIGQGSFGIVYLGQNMKTEPRELVAIKCPVEGRNTSIRREIELQARAGASSSNVLGIHEVIDDEDWELTFIVTDYCPDGDLFDKIYGDDRNYFRDEERVRSVFLQILDGVAACHAQGIYHRDLKPENILCMDGGERILVTDFGFATTATSTGQFGMGTETYMSPEVHGGLHIRLRGYSSAHADIWALGVILLNLATCGEQPWKAAKIDDTHFFYYIMHDPDYLATVYSLSQELNDVIKCIFTANPRNRISLEELRARVVGIREFRVQGVSQASGPSSSNLKKMEEVMAVGKGKGKVVERPKLENNRLASLHQLLAANIIRRCSDSDSSLESASFEALRNDDISIGSQQWPSGLAPVNNAPLMSAFLGGDDIDSITCVETMPVVPRPARRRMPLTVMNPSPPSSDFDSDSGSNYDSDSDSDDSDSDEEAITPETHAVDAATAGDVPEFKLNQSESADALVGSTMPILHPAPLALRIPKSKLPVAAAVVEPTPTDGTYSAGQNMLMIAARRMRMRRARQIGITGKA